MSENNGIQIRCDLLQGSVEIDTETLAFTRLVREKLSNVAREICNARPENADVARMIAFLDKINDAMDTACAAAIIGDETAKRAEGTNLAENSDVAEQHRAKVAKNVRFAPAKPTQFSFPETFPHAFGKVPASLVAANK